MKVLTEDWPSSVSLNFKERTISSQNCFGSDGENHTTGFCCVSLLISSHHQKSQFSKATRYRTYKRAADHSTSKWLNQI